MGVLGDIGGATTIEVDYGFACSYDLTSWDDVNENIAKRVYLASEANHLGFDIISSNCIWFPTSQLQSCPSPLFSIYQLAYASSNGDFNIHNLTISGTSKTFSFHKNWEIVPDEKHLSWFGRVIYGDKAYDTTMECIIEPMQLPTLLKTSVKVYNTFKDFGLYYKFKRNIENDYGKFRFYLTGNAVDYSPYTNRIIETSNIKPSTSVVEFLVSGLTDLLTETIIGYFDFEDVFNNILINNVETPALTKHIEISGDCLIIGSTYGEVNSGDTISIDPIFGMSTVASLYHVATAKRKVASWIIASGNFSTTTPLKINYIGYYARRDATKRSGSAGAIYNFEVGIPSGVGTIVASSQITRLTATGPMWYTATFKTPPILTSGTKYYIAFCCSGAARYYYRAYTRRGQLKNTINWGPHYYDAGWVSPWVGEASVPTNYRYAVYLDYTPLGLTTSKATKVYDSNDSWHWGLAQIGTNSAQRSSVIFGNSPIMWNWGAIGNASNIYVPKSGSSDKDWIWTAENAM